MGGDLVKSLIWLGNKWIEFAASQDPGGSGARNVVPGPGPPARNIGV